MFLRAFEGWHILIIVGLLVVLFGARKLPDSARSIGQSLRIFKSEMKAAGQDADPEPEAGQQADQAAAQPQPKALERGATASDASLGAAIRVTATGHPAGQDTIQLDGVPR